jgi:hypothetical protein
VLSDECEPVSARALKLPFCRTELTPLSESGGKCLDAVSVQVGGNYATGEMREIVDFAARLNTPGVTDAEIQWLVLFARHFVDELDAPVGDLFI